MIYNTGLYRALLSAGQRSTAQPSTAQRSAAQHSADGQSYGKSTNTMLLDPDFTAKQQLLDADIEGDYKVAVDAFTFLF